MRSNATGNFCFPQLFFFSQCWPVAHFTCYGLSGPNQLLAVLATVESLVIVDEYITESFE